MARTKKQKREEGKRWDDDGYLIDEVSGSWSSWMPSSEGFSTLSMAWCRAAITLNQSRTHSNVWLCSGGSRFPTTLVLIPRVTLHINLHSQFPRFFSLCCSPIVHVHSGIVANCDYTSEWVHCVRAWIGIAMLWVTLQKSLLMFLLPASKMQFSLYTLYSSFQVTRSMWLLTIHRSFLPSSVLLLVAISGITCAQPTMFPTLKTWKPTAAGAFLTCTNCETGAKLPEFSGIVGSARANQYSTKVPSSFGSLILNSRCSCHGRRPGSAP